MQVPSGGSLALDVAHGPFDRRHLAADFGGNRGAVPPLVVRGQHEIEHVRREGVVVLEHLAGTLLEVRRGHDLPILRRRQADASHHAVGELNREVGNVETLGVERASGQYYLATPAVLKLRNDSPDGFVPPAVATE